MGFRFRRTIGIIPGVRLNLSKTGVSASLGGKGATVNIGRKGATGTVGIPGSGLSYRTSLTPGRAEASGAAPSASGRRGRGWLAAIFAVAALALFYARHELPRVAAHTSAAPAAMAPETAPSEAPVAATPRTGTAIVNAATATCRETPGRDGKVALKLGRGDTVTVTARQGTWTHVETGVIDCWLSNRTIKLG